MVDVYFWMGCEKSGSPRGCVVGDKRQKVEWRMATTWVDDAGGRHVISRPLTFASWSCSSRRAAIDCFVPWHSASVSTFRGARILSHSIENCRHLVPLALLACVLLLSTIPLSAQGLRPPHRLQRPSAERLFDSVRASSIAARPNTTPPPPLSPSIPASLPLCRGQPLLRSCRPDTMTPRSSTNPSAPHPSPTPVARRRSASE